MIIINFANDINNDSLQVGDYAYYVSSLSTVGGFEQATDDPILIGRVELITGNSITIDNDIPMTTLDNAGDFIMFAKDTSVNISGLVGYFAEVELRNNSNEKAEIYTVSSEITVSSK